MLRPHIWALIFYKHWTAFSLRAFIFSDLPLIKAHVINFWDGSRMLACCCALDLSEGQEVNPTNLLSMKSNF